jgi:hypothetical protein
VELSHVNQKFFIWCFSSSIVCTFCPFRILISTWLSSPFQPKHRLSYLSRKFEWRNGKSKKMGMLDFFNYLSSFRYNLLVNIFNEWVEKVAWFKKHFTWIFLKHLYKFVLFESYQFCQRQVNEIEFENLNSAFIDNKIILIWL